MAERGARKDPRRSRRRRIARILSLIVVAVLVVATAGFLIWANDVAPAEADAVAAVAADPGIEVTDTDVAVVLTPTGEANGTGIVFVPGAKVDPAAYEATFAGAVDTGTTVVITKPVLNLAFFDLRPLDAFTGAAADVAPAVSSWFVGGHSLGGVKACGYAEDGTDADADPAVVGLVLLGSYCATDLSDSGLAVLSITGSDDGLSTPEKVAAAADLLPADAETVEIDGANHASFGTYGAQAGDGVATLDRAEVEERIDELLVPFLAANG